MSSEIVIVALYKFVTLMHYKKIGEDLLLFCNQQNIKGTLLLAEEGINGTVAGARVPIDNLIMYLKQQPFFIDLEYKESYAAELPFEKMKVKFRQEIVKLGIPDINPARSSGIYIQPKDWNKLIADPEILLIDTRNHYEYELGTFKGAIDPNTDNFRNFPEYVVQNLETQKHKKIAMFCTGGIRCEKATSYLLDCGFETVYQLQGGILKYLEEVPEEISLWQGDCFVFDARIAVSHKLKKCDYYAICPQCDEVVIKGIACQRC